ncbi:hypothetical protein FISHEDRAFT_61786 [Fistulina hepatica ATCC 64428]|uniref:DEK C-terminal domain-containing protein n=1 Tax=Fistulina hepatica ATCC 64428 TaxID=1128425 RepID=A0A0D7A3K4_9AGAR|nr:hypothetical protein FISHEDRAFT_61786 [Fistulina hepatica ATCC 64428]
MAVPDFDILEKATTDAVIAARRTKTLSSLTPRILREQLEKRFELEPGALDEKVIKKKIKETILRACDASLPQPLAEANPESDKAVNNTQKPMKTGDNTSSTSKKSQSSPPKSKPSSKQRKAPKTSHKSSATFTSAQMVEDSSDMEVFTTKEPARPSKKRRIEETPEFNTPTVTNGHDASVVDSTIVVTHDDDDKSESEMSVLVDEPPKKKRQGKKEKNEGTKSTAKISKSNERKGKEASGSKPGDSKSDERIKRLKSLVLACGVRKVWSKFFTDDKPAEQIRQLRRLLADLGMHGRLSLEQAKAIRAQRELAQELEDVKQFEKRVVGKSCAKAQSSDDDESESDTENKAPEKRRPRNARQSIMAFLADQSDSDDE